MGFGVGFLEFIEDELRMYILNHGEGVFFRQRQGPGDGSRVLAQVMGTANPTVERTETAESAVPPLTY